MSAGCPIFAPTTRSVRPSSNLARWLLAQVLKDECGHSLGLGVVHMARSADVTRVFDAQQRFEVAGSRVDLWEPAEPEDPQAYNLRKISAAQTRQDMGHNKNQKAHTPLTVRRPGLIRNQAPSSRTVKH